MGIYFSSLLIQGGKSSVLFNQKGNSWLPFYLPLLCMELLIQAMKTMDILSTSSMMVLIVMTRRTNIATRSQRSKSMKNKSLVIIILVLLAMTPGLLMNTMLTIMVMMVITRGQLMLENMDTIVVLSVKTRRSRSATSIPMRTLARSPRQLAKRLLTPSISRSARRSSTLFVRKLTNSIITVSMLLGMNQMLLLDLLAFMKNTRVKAMVMVTREGIRFIFCYV